MNAQEKKKDDYLNARKAYYDALDSRDKTHTPETVKRADDAYRALQTAAICWAEYAYFKGTL